MRRRAVPDGLAWVAMTALLCTGAIVEAIASGLHGTPVSRLLAWQPGLGLSQPWRLWTSAWVHWSLPHLIVNLVGAAVIGAIGWRARAPTRTAAAWFLAWPLTQLLMALPDSAVLLEKMAYYGGLSGVLHAGVIVLGLSLVWPRRPAGPAVVPQMESEFVASKLSVLEPSRATEGPWAMTSLEESLYTALPMSSLEPQSDQPLTPGQAARHRLIGAAITLGTVVKVLLEQPWDLTLRPSAMLGIHVAPVAHGCGIAAGAIAWGLVTGFLAALPARRAA